MHKSSEQGFTLLEVLVALVILAVALTAVLFATNQNTRTAAYLKEKTTASWVGANIFNQLQLGLQPIAKNLAEKTGTEFMLKQQWDWVAHFQITPDKSAIRTEIAVSRHEDENPLYQLIGFIRLPDDQ